MIGGTVARSIYVDNKTNEDIEKMCFTFGGSKFEDTVIKKLKAKPDGVPFTRKIIPLMNINIIGTKKLVMNYYDKNNVKHEYVILSELDRKFADNIGVEILSVKEDGDLEIKVSEHFNG